MYIERYHWRHYFGGLALVFLVAQFLSGLFLILFYQPSLDEAYASVQYLYKSFPIGAWTRDLHRWLALFLSLAMSIHVIRSLLRREFHNYQRRTVWLTGTLFIFPLLAMLITGFILPWEWKGYWFMEMVPNYIGSVPIIGSFLKEYFIESFTMTRTFVTHILILPVISLVLLDIHVLYRLRKRRGGIPGYLLRHGLLTVPFFVIVTLLAIYVFMPTQDPEIIPMPLEGAYIPTAEWLVLVLMVPFMHFEGFLAPFFGLYLPLMLFVWLAVLPYVFGKQRSQIEESPEARGFLFNIFRRVLGIVFIDKSATRAAAFLAVLIAVGILFIPVYTVTNKSPTLGCNSCHNTMMGRRMGVPPEAFKDREIVPLLDDNQWMVEHWFYPQVTW